MEKNENLKDDEIVTPDAGLQDEIDRLHKLLNDRETELEQAQDERDALAEIVMQRPAVENSDDVRYRPHPPAPSPTGEGEKRARVQTCTLVQVLFGGLASSHYQKDLELEKLLNEGWAVVSEQVVSTFDQRKASIVIHRVIRLEREASGLYREFAQAMKGTALTPDPSPPGEGNEADETVAAVIEMPEPDYEEIVIEEPEPVGVQRAYRWKKAPPEMGQNAAARYERRVNGLPMMRVVERNCDERPDLNDLTYDDVLMDKDRWGFTLDEKRAVGDKYVAEAMGLKVRINDELTLEILEEAS